MNININKLLDEYKHGYNILYIPWTAEIRATRLRKDSKTWFNIWSDFVKRIETRTLLVSIKFFHASFYSTKARGWCHHDTIRYWEWTRMRSKQNELTSFRKAEDDHWSSIYFSEDCWWYESMKPEENFTGDRFEKEKY